MKKLLIISITLLFVACGSNNSKQADGITIKPNNETPTKPIETPTNSIIGTPIKFGNIEIAERDFPNKMNWVSAKTACRGLGTGWRLPTNKELGDMYDNRVDIGGFSLSYYWSSTECNPNGSNETAYGQKFFGDGTLVQGQKSNASNVRAVRSF